MKVIFPFKAAGLGNPTIRINLEEIAAYMPKISFANTPSMKVNNNETTVILNSGETFVVAHAPDYLDRIFIGRNEMFK